MDQRDLGSSYLDFSNYYRSVLQVFQMVVNDQWGTTYTTLMRSNNPTMVLLLVTLIPIMISIMIHGFIITTYLSAIKKSKEAEVKDL